MLMAPMVSMGVRRNQSLVHWVKDSDLPNKCDEFITPEGRIEQDNAETTRNTTIQDSKISHIQH